MEICRSIESIRNVVKAARAQGRSIGFVPTMGALHAGHLSLFRLLEGEADFRVASIFVNPTQFAPGEDFNRYPRDEKRDCELLEAEGVDAVFIPSVEEMYRERNRFRVDTGRMGAILCGISRPDHFNGVATVVLKLFNIVDPDVAVFGRKDAQQLAILRRMVRDFNLDIKILDGPIVREPTGLAMSSRNAYLDKREEKAARILYKSLRLGQRMVDGGELDPTSITQAVEDFLYMDPLVEPDYVALVDPDTMEDVLDIEGGELLMLAAHVGKARLIDNLTLEIRDAIPDEEDDLFDEEEYLDEDGEDELEAEEEDDDKEINPERELERAFGMDEDYHYEDEEEDDEAEGEGEPREDEEEEYH